MHFRKITRLTVVILFLFGLMGCGTKQQSAQPRHSKSNPVTTSASNKPNHSHQKEPSAQNKTTKQTKTSQSNQKASQKNQSAKTTSSKVSMNKVTALRLADANTGWIGGNGWIAKSNNGGKDWHIQFRGTGTIHQIFALNHQMVWATIGKDAGQSPSFQLIKSTDGGKHWSDQGSVPNDGFLHFVSGNEAFSSHVETFDGGKTWKKIPTPKNSIKHAYFLNRKYGWIITEEKNTFQIKRTTNGGKTWQTVMTRNNTLPGSALIRSAGPNDAWVELIGGHGMTQTSYSLFHTKDGGHHWMLVIANSTAGGGPAPGMPKNYHDGPHNNGSGPGPLYVLNQNIAFMVGACQACMSSTIGWTNDGGHAWVNEAEKFKGIGPVQLAMADAKHGWLITTNVDNKHVSALFTTSDGGHQWKKVHTFH